MREVPVLRGRRVLLRAVRVSDIDERFEAGRRQADCSRAIAGDLTPVGDYTRDRAQARFSARPDSM